MVDNNLNPIEAKECNISHIFSDLYAFEIPPYQRPYAWEEDQARELLDDLLDAMNNKDAGGGVYFLGSIVLIKSPAIPLSKVVDGQQRLTTLTMLLSVLRDLTADDEMRISRRSYIFQKANPDTGTQDRYRLLLREQDRSFFKDRIQASGTTGTLPDIETLEGSQRQLIENAVYFRNRLQIMNEARRNELVAFIMRNCYLVVVAVPTQDSARRIFTVLNARGMDLTATDILKANLLDRAGNEREKELARRWEDVEQALGRDRMVEIFGHIRMIFERDKPRVALETGFPKVVSPFGGDAEQFISDLLEPISRAALLLADPSQVKTQFGEEAAKAVRSLDRIDNKDWMPPTLWRLWKRAKNDKDIVATFLVKLERLAYFLFVTRVSVNDRMARYAAVLDELDPRKDKEAPTVGLELSETEQAEFVQALDGSLYKKSRVCKPVLQRLDEALSSGGATYDELISIEHVLPQTVDNDSQWAELFADEELRKHWTHRIANLVFLTRRINSRASNWDFDRKKAEYFASEDGSSPFLLTQGVLKTTEWSYQHLQKRQEDLIKTLGKVWNLDAEKYLASSAT